MAERVRNTRALRYRGRFEQIGVCFVRLLRLFVYQNDWKLLPMSVIIAGLVSLVVRNDFFVTMEGTLKGAYNPENDTIAASGSIGEDGENINVVFSFNERWNLVWTGDDGSEPVEFEVDYSPRG